MPSGWPRTSSPVCTTSSPCGAPVPDTQAWAKYINVALINKLQDQFIIKANSAEPLPQLKWDLQSLKALKDKYEKDSTQYSSWQGMMGPRGQVDDKSRQMCRGRDVGAFPGVGRHLSELQRRP